MQRIGVLGASFNPPTIGHQDVINQALPFFDEILLVPSVSHPFRKVLAPLHYRLEMLKIFIETWQGSASVVKIMNIEETIQKSQKEEGPIYTYDVLSALTALYEAYQQPFYIQFILGPDIYSTAAWHQFYRYREIEEKWPLFVAKENIPIHSSLVRKACLQYANNPLLRKNELIRLVGQPIADYLEEHSLYEREDMSKPHAT